MQCSTHSLFMYSEEELAYKFNAAHPFNQYRLVLTVDLLKSIQALDKDLVVKPEAATETDLLRVHSRDYIEAVKSLSQAHPSTEARAKAAQFGLHTEDTPYFPGMHDAASLLSGGSLLAADAVMSGRTMHALHLGGGLHHA